MALLVVPSSWTCFLVPILGGAFLTLAEAEYCPVHWCLALSAARLDWGPHMSFWDAPGPNFLYPATILLSGFTICQIPGSSVPTSTSSPAGRPFLPPAFSYPVPDQMSLLSLPSFCLSQHFLLPWPSWATPQLILSTDTGADSEEQSQGLCLLPKHWAWFCIGGPSRMDCLSR